MTKILMIQTACKFGKILTAFLILTILSFPTLCAAEDVEGKAPATLVVTKNFSRPPLVEKRVPAEGSSCMDILRSCARVETAYGGSFIVSINGISGTSNAGAWFYYVNGVMADVGADRHTPRAGDVIQWDFHPWRASAWIAAIVGSYPQPFLSGGCRMFHSPRMAEPSARLAGRLRGLGVDGVVLRELDGPKPPGPGPPAIIVGSREELEKVGWVKDILDGGRRAGLFIDFGKTGMNVFNVDGQRVKTFADAGALVAMKRGYGAPAWSLWLVTGTGDESVLGVLELLLDRPGEMEFFSGALVTEDGVKNVPLP